MSLPLSRLLFLAFAAAFSWAVTRAPEPALSPEELEERALIEEALRGPIVSCVAADTASGCARTDLGANGGVPHS